MNSWKIVKINFIDKSRKLKINLKHLDYETASDDSLYFLATVINDEWKEISIKEAIKKGWAKWV